VKSHPAESSLCEKLFNTEFIWVKNHTVESLTRLEVIQYKGQLDEQKRVKSYPVEISARLKVIK